MKLSSMEHIFELSEIRTNLNKSITLAALAGDEVLGAR